MTELSELDLNKIHYETLRVVCSVPSMMDFWVLAHILLYCSLLHAEDGCPLFPKATAAPAPC